MKPQHEHHYERPQVTDITQRLYWEKEERVALASLRIARKNLAGLRFKGQLAFNLSAEQPNNIVELKPDYPDIVA